MASLGHVLLGMAAGRAYLPRLSPRASLIKAMVGFSALSMLPDLDVIAFAFGIPYEAALGHRGWTHSFVFALLGAGVAAALAAPLKQPRLRLAAFTFGVLASHCLLDTLTTGGLGAALFWPFSDARFFAPLRPIPVAPIGLYMFSMRGLLVMCVELVMFLPFLIYATAPRKQPVS